MSDISQDVQDNPIIVIRWRIAKDWPIDYVSSNISTLGYSQEQLLSEQKKYVDIIHPDDRERVELEVINYLENNIDAYAQKYRILTADGKEIWVDDRTSVVRDKSGDINYIQGAIIDISARKKMQDEISRSEQHLKLLREQSPITNIEWDTDFQVVAWNQAAEKMFGYTYNEVKGRQIIDLIFPDNESSNVLEICNKLISKQGGTHAINENKQKDGNIILCEWYNTPLVDELGTVIGVASLCIDITSQQTTNQEILEKEQELREILDSMADAVISVDQQGVITTFNNAAEQLFGYKKDEIIGQKVYCLMSERLASEHDEYLSRYLKTGIAHALGKNREIEAIHKNKDIIPIRLSVAELPADPSGAKRFIATCQDLRNLKEQEELLRRSQKMDALGKLTGGIAHDYNNMLGVVLGYAEMLEKNLLDQPRLAKYANQIYKAGERGAKLTKRLLSFSRHDSPTQANKVSLNTLLQEQQDMLQKTLTVRIHLLLELADDLWNVSLDESEFEDAILNMSINAMHAMTEGGDLTISTHNQSLSPLDAMMLGIPAGDYVQLTISDTGTGMDGITKNKLFDPFFSTKGNRGTGLGLSQVFGFVKRAHGVINVHSKVGEGSQFILYFPRIVNDEKGTDLTVEQSSQDTTGKENILIVDDEPALLNLLTSILVSEGYTVFRAESGQLALEILKQEHIELMISDVIMPKMDGYQLASIVQNKYPDVKIQLASGYSDERQKGKFNKHLYNHIIFKPYDSATLLKKIRTLLDNEQIVIPNDQKSKLIPPVEWSDKLSVAIPEIDSDHKMLLSLLNRCIISANDADNASNDEEGILNDLLSYTEHHFQREENVMDICNYPDKIKHCEAHNTLLNEIKERQKKFKSHEGVPDSLLHFLTNWLVKHIVGMDKDLDNYCKGHEETIAKALQD